MMDVECACDLLWIMYAFCVMLNACVLSHVLYMSFACLLSKESNKQKKLQISQLCRVPTLGKEVFAECQGCGTRQSWKKNTAKQPLPQFCRVPQPGTRQRGQFCRVPQPGTRQRGTFCRVPHPGTRQRGQFCRVLDGTTRQRIFLKRFF